MYITVTMPVVLLERLPLPSLRTYVTVSVLLTSCAIYYAHLAQNVALGRILDPSSTQPQTDGAQKPPPMWPKTSEGYFYDKIALLIGEGWCVWVRHQSQSHHSLIQSSSV